MKLAKAALTALLCTTFSAVAGGFAIASETSAPVTVYVAKTVTFDTSLVAVDHPSGGAYEGTLSITIGKSGTILGYYRPVDSGAFEQVSGGLDGDRIHLEIGANPPIDGVYRNGKIVGYTFVNELTHRFTAKVTGQPNV
ncbi:MAG: hypothetical protein IAI49_03150 [Candidatus Eremiobacteraeota bacterium]|nr:hypothetical protein [Candidatus Eremiobacteraeota bacterium]